MGDRANIFIGSSWSGEFRGVYLYTHWGGSELPEVLQRALKKDWRWNDDPYLARIIFCEMVKGNEAEETGFGISAVLGDGAYRILKVDSTAQTITQMRDGKTWTFSEYCALSVDDLYRVWDAPEVSE